MEKPWAVLFLSIILLIGTIVIGVMSFSAPRVSKEQANQQFIQQSGTTNVFFGVQLAEPLAAYPLHINGTPAVGICTLDGYQTSCQLYQPWPTPTSKPQ